MKKWFNCPNFGLLFIRVALGIMLIAYWVPMLLAGKSNLEHTGSVMALIGVHFAPLLWGVLAALSCIIGGSLYIIGFLFRPVSIILCFNMIMAILFQFSQGDSFVAMSHSIELACIFFGLLWIGPGKYSVDKE
jgi:putative oxidoreductase